MTAKQVAKIAVKELFMDGEEKYAQELEEDFRQHILCSLDDYLQTTDTPDIVDFSETLEGWEFLDYIDWATNYIEGEISNYEDQAYSMAKDER